MVVQTNHQTTKYAVENKWHGDWFTNGEKPTRQKPHRMIFRSPLLKFHYYHNKRLQVKESLYLIPIYSWTLTPIPNWTCFIVTISPFDARLPSTWLTNCGVRNFNHQLEKVVGYEVLQFIHTMKIKKMLGHKSLWCTYIATSSDEMNYGETLSPVINCLNKLCSTLMQLVSTFMALKIILLYV